MQIQFKLLNFTRTMNNSPNMNNIRQHFVDALRTLPPLMQERFNNSASAGNASVSENVVGDIATAVFQKLQERMLTLSSSTYKTPSPPVRSTSNLSHSVSGSSTSSGTLSRSSSSGMPALVEHYHSDVSSEESSSEESVRAPKKRTLFKKRGRRRKSNKKNKARRRRRRRQNDNLSRDKKAVNEATMALLDKQFLAPFKSSMFYRKLKKNTTNVLKQREDIDLELFKRETRHLRARLCSRDLNALREQDPTLTSDTLSDRYEAAMLTLVRKRRANHLQSWRVHKTHLRLIYSTDTTVRLNPGRQPDVTPQAATQSVDDDQSTEPEFSEPDFEEEPQVPASQVPDDKSCEPDFEEPQVPAPPVPANSPRPPVTIHQVTTKCEVCGVTVNHNSGFPQDSDQWATKTTVRCPKCFDKHVQTVLIPEIANEEARAKKARQYDRVMQRRDNKKRKSSEPQVPNKRKKRTQCRCGSKTHVMVTHRDCPLNKKNLDHDNAIVATREIILNRRREAINSTTPSPPPSNSTPSPPSPPPPSSTPSPPPPTPPSTPPPTPYLPTVGRNALVRYRRNEWYLAHITSRNEDGRYDVYFPEDFKVKKSVPASNIRPVDSSCTEPTRGELLGKVFFYPGDDEIPAGKWTVRRLQGNEYTCTCCDPKATLNIDNFEVGYVISCYKKDLQRRHENPFGSF